MNRDHSVIFEIASKYCILDSFVDYRGYSISSKEFLPTVVDKVVTELNSYIPVHFRSLIPKLSVFTLAISCFTTSNLPWFMDLTFKIRNTKGTFHAKMGSRKDRDGMDLTEVEHIKKRWQEYTEELYKKDLYDPGNHDSVVTQLEPDILECEVKWALRSISTNKASGGDGIPVELFQILKDDAVKMLHSICQQIGKTQQWPQDWKRSVFIPISKKGNAKDFSDNCTIVLISHARKVKFKILQARLQQYMNRDLQMFKLVLERQRNQRSNWQHPLDYQKSKRLPEKHLFLLYWLCQPLIVWITTNCGKFWKRWATKPTDLPLEKSVCRSGSGHGTTDWFQIGKGVRQGYMLSPCLFNLYAEHSMINTGLEEAQAGIKIARRNINNLRYADDTTLMAESEEELKKASWWKWKRRVKGWLKVQHSENEDHGIRSHHFMGNRWGNSGNSVRLYFFWLQKSLQMVIEAMRLKDAYSLEGKLWPI